MPDRKEPRLEIDPVKPAAPSVERPASTATARPRPETPARPASAVSSAKATPAHPMSSESPAVSVKPETPTKPVTETPLRHQPVESVYKSERAGSHGKPSESGSSAYSAGAGGSGGSGGHYPANLESNGSGSGGSTLLVWFALLLALAGLIFGGWQYTRVDKQQESMQRLADRVQELEIRLSETGQDLSKAGSTFREQLEWADSEIRKLWVIAHQRNQPAIVALQGKMKEVEERANKAEAQLKEAVTASAASRQTSNETKTQLQALNDKIAGDLRELGQRLTEVTLVTSTLDQRLRNQDQSSKMNTLSKKVDELGQRVSAGGMPPELEQKLTEQEEILASLEASRSQLVSRVTRLMDEVRELQQAR